MSNDLPPRLNALPPRLQIPLTDEQARLYTTNTFFKAVVDSLIHQMLPMLLDGAVTKAITYERQMEEAKRHMVESPFRRIMSQEDFEALVGSFGSSAPPSESRPQSPSESLSEEAGDCAICLGTGVDYIGRPCRIHGSTDEED